MTDIVIRPAQPGDEPIIIDLLRKLAIYERMQDRMKVTPDVLADAMFGSPAILSAIVAYDAHTPVGLGTWYWQFGSFAGRKKLYVEDLFVDENLRGKGIGLKLMAHMAQVALDHNAIGMSWGVLDWNTPSIEFYKNLGACVGGECVPCALDLDDTQKLAAL